MKKTYLLLSILVLSLMTAGFSYAYWSDTLTVSGMAQTGELSVIFTDSESCPIPNSQYHSATSYISEDSKTLYVTFENLYPGSYATLNAEITNNGTIPAKLINMQLVNVTFDGLDEYNDANIINDLKNNLMLTATVSYHTVTENGVLTLGDNNEYFYEPGELDFYSLALAEGREFDLRIDLLPGASNLTQGRTVHFQILLDYGQYNEPEVS